MIFQNKQNWKPTAIGEIAFEYSKRCDNPSNSGYDKFVGSENIDRFDYKVKNWQSTDDVISAMKLFPSARTIIPPLQISQCFSFVTT